MWFKKPQGAVKSKPRMESFNKMVYERVPQNQMVILTVDSHSRDLLHFVAQQTTHLVNVNVLWNTDLKSDKNADVECVSYPFH